MHPLTHAGGTPVVDDTRMQTDSSPAVTGVALAEMFAQTAGRAMVYRRFADDVLAARLCFPRRPVLSTMAC